MVFKLKQEISSNELAKWLNLESSGVQLSIYNVSSLDSVTDGSLSFVSKNHQLQNSSDKICLITNVIDYSSVIISDNPRLDFIRALLEIDKRVGFEENNIQPEIHSTVRIGQNVVIENGVKIDAGSVIGHGVVIKTGSIIGKNCLIRDNACIGGDGFGFEVFNGMPIKFIHLGGVEIGDNVEIGSCTCIARGTLGNTKINSNVKIDNLVHVAHNCVIEEGSLITAGAELSGGVVLGKNVWIGPNSCVIQKVKIGDNSLVGIGAVVIRDVEAGVTVVGNPARVLENR